MQNLFTKIIPAADMAKVLDLLRQIVAILTPYLTPLTPDQRQQMLKMGTASVEFVGKARGYALENEKFRPVSLDFDEFNHDAEALIGLSPLHKLLGSLDLDVDSTMMTAGSDSYSEALLIYNYVHLLATTNYPGAQAAYEDMRESLPIAHGRRTKKDLPTA